MMKRKTALELFERIVKDHDVIYKSVTSSIFLTFDTKSYKTCLDKIKEYLRNIKKLKSLMFDLSSNNMDIYFNNYVNFFRFVEKKMRRKQIGDDFIKNFIESDTLFYVILKEKIQSFFTDFDEHKNYIREKYSGFLAINDAVNKLIADKKKDDILKLLIEKKSVLDAIISSFDFYDFDSVDKLVDCFRMYYNFTSKEISALREDFDDFLNVWIDECLLTKKSNGHVKIFNKYFDEL